MTLLFQLSSGWIQFIQFFLGLSILIVLHEWGHYFAARRTGTRVERFYLFFDFLFPFGGLLNFSLWKKKKGDTEYGIGWFPLGGYVKIAGMMDESADKEALALPAKPDEFRSKTALQRMFIMLGGIIVNVLIGILAYWFVFATYGEKKLANNKLTYGIAADSLARAVGVQSGDVIVEVNRKPVPYFNDVLKELVFGSTGESSITVQRQGEQKVIPLPAGTVAGILKRKTFIDPRVPFIIDSVSPKAKFVVNALSKDDKMLSVNGVSAQYFDQYLAAKKAIVDSIKKVAADANTKARLDTISLQLRVLRGTDTVAVTCKLDTAGATNVFARADYTKFFEYDKQKFSFASALPQAASKCWTITTDYVRNLKALFTSKEVKVSESLGGFASFMKLFPDSWSLEGFMRMLGFVSILLAFMNLLPIPGLDGGYVFFLIIEMIIGRKVNDKVMEWANMIGLVLLLGLMVYANGLDVARWLKK